MAKTLIVKLAGTVDNDDLRKLGEIRILVQTVSSECTENTQLIRVGSVEPIQLKTTGSVYFTDSTLTQNLGTTATTLGINRDEAFYLSNGDGTLRIYNKYALTRFVPSDGVSNPGWKLNTWDFAGCEALTYFCPIYLKVTEDSTLEPLSGLHNLDNIVMISSGVKGELSSLSGLTKMTRLIITNSPIYGNISCLAGLTNLTNLNVSGCSYLTGDTSSIAHLHPNNGGKLATFNYGNTGITGSWPPATE